MITDWDEAYNNRAQVGESWYEAFSARYSEEARAFREQMQLAGRARLNFAYGNTPREMLDFFLPEGTAKGLICFVHGGFWRLFDKSQWSHLAAGVLAQGWAMAVPSYTLAPNVRISQITRQIARAIICGASHLDGPIRLVGHSAGGHLVSRMLCRDVALPPEIASRIDHVVSISGVHDCRPMLRLSLNEIFGFDEEEAIAESPALRMPVKGASITCWAGGAELPEFIRQNDLLANIWTGLGADTQSILAPGKNHFTVLEDLKDAESELTQLIAR